MRIKCGCNYCLTSIPCCGDCAVLRRPIAWCDLCRQREQELDENAFYRERDALRERDEERKNRESDPPPPDTF